MSTSLKLYLFQELQISVDFNIVIPRLDLTKSVNAIVCVLLKCREDFSESNSSLLCRLSSPTSGSDNSGNSTQYQPPLHTGEPCGASGCAQGS